MEGQLDVSSIITTLQFGMKLAQLNISIFLGYTRQIHQITSWVPSYIHIQQFHRRRSIFIKTDPITLADKPVRGVCFSSCAHDDSIVLTVRLDNSARKYTNVPRNCEGVSGTGNINIRLVLVQHPKMENCRVAIQKRRYLLTICFLVGTGNKVRFELSAKFGSLGQSLVSRGMYSIFYPTINDTWKLTLIFL